MNKFWESNNSRTEMSSPQKRGSRLCFYLYRSRIKSGMTGCITSAPILLATILLLAFVFRIYGLNWDQNQHLHPDERFLTMVVGALKWPPTFYDYLDSRISTLNPNNVGYSFYVYGTFPLTLVKYLSPRLIFDTFDYNNITLAGRLISAFFDLGTLFMVFLIGKKIASEKVGLLAAFIYSISVLPIQLSHFFAVDTFLVFFLTLSFYFLLQFLNRNRSSINIQPPSLSSPRKRGSRLCFYLYRFPIRSGMTWMVLTGISLGLALACKISALLFVPVIFLIFFFHFLRSRRFFHTTYLPAIALASVGYLLLTILFCYLAVRLADPHIFSSANFFDLRPNPNFVANIKELKGFDNPDSLFPPGVQWIATKPVIFPLYNIVFWGLGLPLGVLSVISVVYLTLLTTKEVAIGFYKFSVSFPPRNYISHLTIQQLNHSAILSFVFIFFFYNAFQYAKSMRYFYLIYPLLAVVTANFIYQVLVFFKSKLGLISLSLLYCFIVILLLVWPIAFSQIYSRPHSRVTASEWIYQNIPAGSTISCESWDDCLPLSISEKYPQLYKYQTEALALFDPDSAEKWIKLNMQLAKVDYLVLSSNRLWGSIPKVPDKYPIASKFYNDLFAGKLNFHKVAEITSYPTVPILNIPIPDDSSEEAFTVYDHPKILIYKNINKVQ